MYDLVRRFVEKAEQDGTSFPIVSFRGDFIDFASSDFAEPLIGLIKNILEKVGPESMEELDVLHREYMNQWSRGEFRDTNILKRVIKEAYERRLETELTLLPLLLSV